MVNSISQHLVQDCFRITPSSDFGKYLGFPILNRNPRAADFHYILDKMRKKLSSWKVNFLTTARRITLAKSTLNAIPAYAMQYVQLPMKICNTIDKIQRDFLWGSTTHYIAWEKVTSPKDCGGLGLQKADTKNKALLTGLAWRLIMNQSSLWAKTLIMKLLMFGITVGYPTPPALRTILQGPLNQGEDHLTVSSLWNDTSWDWSKISFNIPPDIVQKASKIQLNRNLGEWDIPYWSCNSNGIFTTKSLYGILNPNPNITFPFAWIWKLHTIEKHKVLLWLWAQGRLPTHAYLHHIGIDIDPLCPVCSLAHETIEHVFLETIEYITHIQSPSNPDATTSIDIQWFLPPLGFYKLNTDGSLSKNKGIGGIGGIIRNSSEGWMVGFHNQTHCHSHTMSEIEAFLTGLHITFTHNLFPLEVGIDSLEILQFLEDSPPTYSSIIMSCRSMLKKLGNPTVRYNFRQANMVADVLSKIGAKLTMTNQPQILLSP
ncbi:hypothetical protein KY290_010274 [Solanum tuberosum]|uniref:RNase H family protein n=1 Tax=Solanum tuberosum TaxID=4113 RepID=A0ABQ7VXC0_SOLTU|nr:hypothetical protein KY290_010274 [Solanum tuberosum]